MVKRTSIEIKGVIEKPEEKHNQGKSGLIFCQNCGAVYYKKSWHHELNKKIEIKKEKFGLCPACQMIKNKQFEGEIIIENIPLGTYNNLVNLTKAFCRRAYGIDPLDRLIEIKKIKQGLRITVTENQLAVKLAKKIKQVFRKVDMKISYSPAPSDVVYIKLEFKN